MHSPSGARLDDGTVGESECGTTEREGERERGMVRSRQKGKTPSWDGIWGEGRWEEWRG